MICPFGARSIQYDAFEARFAGLKALLNGNGVELQIQCRSGAALQMPLSRGIANSMMFGGAIANAAQQGGWMPG